METLPLPSQMKIAVGKLQAMLPTHQSTRIHPLLGYDKALQRVVEARFLFGLLGFVFLEEGIELWCTPGEGQQQTAVWSDF